MQPYVFPYVGYFCLINASDVFVFLDDVNYIKRGWINRNRILIDGKPFTFTIPVVSASQNKLINEIKIYSLEKFRNNFLKQLKHSYKLAPHFDSGMDYVCRVLDTESDSLSSLAIRSIEIFCEHIELNKKFLRASIEFPNLENLNGVDRLVNITKLLESKQYNNLIGGKQLYSMNYMSKSNVNLNFIDFTPISYRQVGADKFCEKLSIIDVLMNNSVDEIKKMVRKYGIE